MSDTIKEYIRNELLEIHKFKKCYEDAYELYETDCGAILIDLQQLTINLSSGHSGSGGFVVRCSTYEELEKKLYKFYEFLEID